MISKASASSLLIYLVVFLTGAMVMILEITGARIIAPYLGSSLIAWTSLIGVVLAFLSVGYIIGGKIADKNPSFKFLSLLYLSIAFFVTIIPLIDETILSTVTLNNTDLKLNSLAGCIILFSVPSILLGIAAPYLIRLKITGVSSSGETIGILYALSTFGSILGTFITGFFLFSIMGSAQTLFSIALLATLIAFSFGIKARDRLLIASSFLAACFIGIAYSMNIASEKNSLVFETNYSRISIVESEFSGKKVITMLSGNLPMSAMYADSDDLVYNYTKLFRLVSHFSESPKKALIIGGAGFSYPKDFLRQHPEADLDVLEIDPKLTQLARAHFNLPNSSKLKIFHEDGRTFINKSSSKYDAIIIDAFEGSMAVPFQLTTKEFIAQLNRVLEEDGVIIMNTISAIDGPKGKFLRAEYYTYKSIFPYVYVIPASNPNDSKFVQNVVLIAAKRQKPLSSMDPEMQAYLSLIWNNEIKNDTPILTDNFAPVEFFAIERY